MKNLTNKIEHEKLLYFVAGVLLFMTANLLIGAAYALAFTFSVVVIQQIIKDKSGINLDIKKIIATWLGGIVGFACAYGGF